MGAAAGFGEVVGAVFEVGGGASVVFAGGEGTFAGDAVDGFGVGTDVGDPPDGVPGVTDSEVKGLTKEL